MGSRRTSELLQLPVRLRGIRLGQPVDVLLDAGARRAIGFVVLCGDDVPRFLPCVAAQPEREEIAVGSALLLLEDVGFYTARSTSLRALLGGEVTSGGRRAGRLRDVLLAPDGAVEALVAEGDGHVRRLEPGAAAVEPRRASIA